MRVVFKKCPDCLTENAPDAKFCYNCGFSFQKDENNEFDIDVFYNIDDLIDDVVLIFKGENYKRSLEMIDSYLESFGEDEYAWSFKSHILSKLGYLSDAVFCCDIALNIDDACEVAWASKAYHLNNLQNFEAALSCCDLALILNSDDAFIKKLRESINNMDINV